MGGHASPAQLIQMERQARDEFNELAKTEPVVVETLKFANFRGVNETTALLLCVNALARMLRIEQHRRTIPLTTQKPKGDTQ